ncbi:peptidoglycan DD-metalloendopeptidase family protein [Limibacter armeniacum]|uniref:peptidoglycan DD-metalloendopeptidase family protein n=1 Tax=Limibacter armeniacum TaxID=466084 RepID=UPI002FE58EB0
MQKKITITIIGLIILLVGGLSFFYTTQEDLAISYSAADEALKDSLQVDIKKAKEIRYGIEVDSLEVLDKKINRNETLADILLPYNVSFEAINQIAANSREVFDVRKFRAGGSYTMISERDSIETGKYLIYHVNPVDYVVYELSDSLKVYEGHHEVEIHEKVITAEINSSLYQAMIDAGATPLLANNLSDIFAWQIDFFHIQKGDRFKVVYEEQSVKDKFVGVGEIKSAFFLHAGEEFYAFLYQRPDHEGMEYFDEKGNSLRKAFLKAPLNYARISSRFNRNRFHPVLKRVKPHLGTDYAAPTGTPIQSVGDGVVIAKGYTRGNGNYVKIRHNGTYTTQYLHMSKFAKGMKQGKAVKQGDVIGYVGSTGLATGPHLCFRFWKNGRQVDWLREKMPASEPIEKAYELDYLHHMDTLKQHLDNLLYEDNSDQVM